MKQQTENYITPYRYDRPVMTGIGEPGRFDEQGVDIPFVFYHRGRWRMMYTGFDGIGYQTALAASDDLLHWEYQGLLLARGGGNGWDDVSAAGTWLLKEDDGLQARPTLRKVDGKYWMVYHSYPGAGYESGPAEIGLAWCEDEELLCWNRLKTPVFSWRDGEKWERGGLYKACLLYHEGQYFLFYNAKDQEERWVEQTGLATSSDLLHWRRCPDNPVLAVSAQGWDTKFLSDPCILRQDGEWLNFFFGYDYSHAREGLAFSRDLFHWEKHPNPILDVGAPGSLDETHAHKASVVWHQDTLYHFYCAVRPGRPADPTVLGGEFRCITVAASRPLPDRPSCPAE